jgi:uncharacterized protein YukE
MGRVKKSTSHYDDAVQRSAGMKSISPTLDLGNGLTVVAYETAINDFRQKLDEYNTSLSEADSRLNTVKDTEKKLRDLSERMINGVASKYGKDSDEYEMAGGIRKSDRKRTNRIKKTLKV